MSPSYQDLLATAREVIPEVEPSEVAPRVEAGDGPLIIDVRETERAVPKCGTLA